MCVRFSDFREITLTHIINNGTNVIVNIRRQLADRLVSFIIIGRVHIAVSMHQVKRSEI